MTSGERAQKFHTDDASLLRSGLCFWLDEANFPRGTTNQNHYSDLGSDASSVWNFCARFSDVISRGNQWWRRQMSAVFSVYFAICHREFISVSVLFYIPYEFLFVIRQHYQNRNIAKHEQAVLHFQSLCVVGQTPVSGHLTLKFQFGHIVSGQLQ